MATDFVVDEQRIYTVNKTNKAIIAEFLKPKFELCKDYHDSELLLARGEVKGIVGNLRKAARTKGLDPGYLFDIVDLVAGNLLQLLFTEVSERYHNRSGEVLTKELLNRLVRTFWVIGLQGESASGYFRKLNDKSRWVYHANWLVTHRQYSAFMLSLDEDPAAQRGIGIPGINAQSPLLKEIHQSISDGFSILCRDVPNLNVVIDDHQVPGAGKTDSFKKKRNEKKAACIGIAVDVGATSLIRMPCILSTPHGTVKVEDALEGAIKRFAEKTRSKNLRGSTWFVDRGYGRVRATIAKLHGDYIATVKRGGNTEPETPFTFDPAKNTSKKILNWMKVIDENGGPMLEACRVGKIIYVAYRHRPGKVVLIATTIKKLAFSWTFALPRLAWHSGDRRISGVSKLNLDSRSDDENDIEDGDSDDDESDDGNDHDHDNEGEGDDNDEGSDDDDRSDDDDDGDEGEEDDGSEADLSDECEEIHTTFQRNRCDEDPQDDVINSVVSSAGDRKRGLGRALSDPPMSSGVLRLSDLDSDVDGSFVVSKVCLERMASFCLPCRELTRDQRTPIWFSARVGVASSTAVSVVLTVDAHNQIADTILGCDSRTDLAGPFTQPVNLLLGVDAPHVDEDSRTFVETIATWNSLNESERIDFLVEYCQAHRKYLDRLHNLLRHKVSPTKDQLRYCGPLGNLTKEQLLLAAKAFSITLPSQSMPLPVLAEMVRSGREEFANRGCNLCSALIDGCWGFRSLGGSDAMRNGTIAEPHAREKLPMFVRLVGQALHDADIENDFAFCSEVFELGLLEAHGNPYAVTSVDGSLFVSSEANPKNADRLIQLVWENKTLFSEKTIDEANRLESDYGCYSFVDFRNGDSEGELERKLANLGSRKGELVQIVHHAAVTGADVLYTLMDGYTGEFIRMVRISFDEDWRKLHLSTIQKIFCHHVPITFDDTVTMEVGENEARVTSNEFLNVLKMRRAIREGNLGDTSGRFLPTLARIWNRTKSAVDAQSKEVISLRVQVGGDVRRKLICESLLFVLVGSVRLLRAHKICDKVDMLQGRDHILRAMTLEGSTRSLIQQAMDEIEEREVQHEDMVPIQTGSTTEAFRTPAPSSATYDPTNPKWEDRARREIENVASTSASKAEAFAVGILNEIRTNETPGTWCAHTKVTCDRDGRDHCVICCAVCDKFWRDVGPDEIKASTKEEIIRSLNIYHARPSRRGYKSKVKCGCCLVTLCDIPRHALYGSDASCWDVWHSVSKLPIQHPMFPSGCSLAKKGNVTSAARMEADSAKPTGSAQKRRRRAQVEKNYHGY